MKKQYFEDLYIFPEIFMSRSLDSRDLFFQRPLPYFTWIFEISAVLRIDDLPVLAGFGGSSGTELDQFGRTSGEIASSGTELDQFGRISGEN